MGDAARDAAPSAVHGTTILQSSNRTTGSGCGNTLLKRRADAAAHGSTAGAKRAHVRSARQGIAQNPAHVAAASDAGTPLVAAAAAFPYAQQATAPMAATGARAAIRHGHQQHKQGPGVPVLAMEQQAELSDDDEADEAAAMSADEEPDIITDDEEQQAGVDDARNGNACWKARLWSALHLPPPPSSIACTASIDDAPFLCPDVAVAGLGRLGLPLSSQQAAALAGAAGSCADAPGVYKVGARPGSITMAACGISHHA